MSAAWRVEKLDTIDYGISREMWSILDDDDRWIANFAREADARAVVEAMNARGGYYKGWIDALDAAVACVMQEEAVPDEELGEVLLDRWDDAGEICDAIMALVPPTDDAGGRL